jgi:hypothetical protein
LQDGVITFFPVVFPAKQAAIHVEGKNEGFQGTYLIGETSRSSPESFILREKPLLPVSGQPQDAFKSHISSSNASKIADFFSCLAGKTTGKNVMTPYWRNIAPGYEV